ncbi:ECF transporter S component [uncultured Megasphaera sp.]|uniref:ECF transporter S component n=1 Tax=uncultured Megasphaera sp. TaxID=165188 RepID=UPI00259591D3|nr:ECF transporter S component [uncultured Megasphaera sp.]
MNKYSGDSFTVPVKKALFTTQELTIIGMLAGITVLLGVTGYGFIPLPMMKATILHVPVIIGAVLAGPRVGIMVGFLFGCFSIIQAIMSPVVLSFALLNPLISILPRILIAVGAYYTYIGIRKLIRQNLLSLAIAGFIGSAINTIGVMGGIFLLYAKHFAEVRHIPVAHVADIIIGICAMNGLPEALISAFITASVVTVLQRVVRK